jgi:hypothetical protein
MSFASVLISAEKGIEVGIEDALKIFGTVEKKSPSAVTALTALAGAVETALAAAAADTNVSTLVITLPTTVADFKNVWEDGKAFLASLGIK